MDLQKIKILSARKWNTYFPLQVIYEWEDIISGELEIPIDAESMVGINKKEVLFINKISQRFFRKTFLGNLIDSSFDYLKRKNPDISYLIFILYPLPIRNHYVYSSNMIPVLLDCFTDVINKVPYYFRKSKLLFVTNLEVFNYLKKTSLGDRIAYLPLSISDKYYMNTVPAKDIDVLQMGRQNPVLHKWMMKLLDEHPEIEYVYSDLSKGQHSYYSTKNGLLGPAETRAAFMQLLSRSKISLLSSPGIDGGELRTGGMNPVTPRFYESAVNYCYMIGRFPDAPDFIYNGVSNVCDRPTDYDEFKKLILFRLSQGFNKQDKYKKFIDAHVTSFVARQMALELVKR